MLLIVLTLIFNVNEQNGDGLLFSDTVSNFIVFLRKCCMLSGEVGNTDLIVFGLTLPGLKTQDLQHSIRRPGTLPNVKIFKYLFLQIQ